MSIHLKRVTTQFVCFSLLLGSMVMCKKDAVEPIMLSTTTDDPKLQNQSKNFDFRTDRAFQSVFGKNQTNSQQLVSKSMSVDMQDIYDIWDMHPEADRRAAFLLLSPEEQYVYWDSLTKRLIDSQTELTVAQRALLHELREDVLSEDIYSGTQAGEDLRDKLEYFLPSIIGQLVADGIAESTILVIFEHGSNSPDPDDLIIPHGATIWTDCSCNTDFILTPACQTNFCHSSSIGCGFFWLSACNGHLYHATVGGMKYYKVPD